ncbi:hypothetical protein LCGC14_1730360 [marine sediment metagenome]|uniref:Uncharacterized protein n=1 Tax=marine sediment metagenome TaxID=412755 RepID=A0A0F9JQE2_9ZZZZ
MVVSTPFDNFRCEKCGHVARRHMMHTGPCSDCWEQMVEKICRHFIMREEDREAVMAIEIPSVPQR